MRRRQQHAAPPTARPEEPPASLRRIVEGIAKVWEFDTYWILAAAFVVFGWMYFTEKIWRDPIGKYAVPSAEVTLLLILVYKLRIPAGRAANRLKAFYERYKGEQKPF
jgi:hypothetical protein